MCIDGKFKGSILDDNTNTSNNNTNCKHEMIKLLNMQATGRNRRLNEKKNYIKLEKLNKTYSHILCSVYLHMLAKAKIVGN